MSDALIMTQALFGTYSGPFELEISGQLQRFASDEDLEYAFSCLLNATSSPAISSIVDDKVHFVFDTYDECLLEELEPALPPTVVLYQFYVTILGWALEEPISTENSDIKTLMTDFSYENDSTFLPVAGFDKWQLVSCNPAARYSLVDIKTLISPTNFVEYAL